MTENDSQRGGNKGAPIYGIRITVVKSHPDCRAQHKVGDTWEDNCGLDKDSIKGFICPSAYFALHPIVFGLRYGVKFPWIKDSETSVCCCPAIDTPVHFKIDRVKDKVRWYSEENETEQTC